MEESTTPLTSPKRRRLSPERFERCGEASVSPIRLPPPGAWRKRRRDSVSAETDVSVKLHQIKHVEKPESVKSLLVETLRRHPLLGYLDEPQLNDVASAMGPVQVGSGSKVITQGDEGDYFYVVEKGVFLVFKQENVSAEPRLVNKYDDSGCFGELALLYNAKRAASVVAATDGLLWTVDRLTFRAIVIEHFRRKRVLHEDFLSKVPLLSKLLYPSSSS